ncbi:hypothetical protein TWF694_001954 [Orbilia ellipsospora]|uniref:Uncharacterized protein n=1 Tax=Orbilia ellipsospora TaxID=2528407 RepID=A0AAV9X708_9PEZI
MSARSVGTIDGAILCGYWGVSLRYKESGTTFEALNQYFANRTFVFDKSSDELIITSGQASRSVRPLGSTETGSISTTSLAARPGSSATSITAPSQTPSDSGNPNGGGKNNSSRLSTGATAGIAVNTGIPMILGIMYLTY